MLDTVKRFYASCKRPGTWLGFLLSMELIGAFTLAKLQWDLPILDPYRLTGAQWILAFAAGSAMVGWTVSAIVTMRNSVRQHTVNTLLQSRLSAEFMSRSDKVAAHFNDYDARAAAGEKLGIPTDGIDEAALRYILNYYEFVAIGIWHGDLDEKVLRDSLRGMVVGNILMSKHWIKRRIALQPKAMAFLLQLADRWMTPDERKTWRTPIDSAQQTPAAKPESDMIEIAPLQR